jgi:hypothetical protein
VKDPKDLLHDQVTGELAYKIDGGLQGRSPRRHDRSLWRYSDVDLDLGDVKTPWTGVLLGLKRRTRTWVAVMLDARCPTRETPARWKAATTGWHAVRGVGLPV